MFESDDVQEVCARAYGVQFDRLSADQKAQCYQFIEDMENNRVTLPPMNLYPLACSWLRVHRSDEASVYAYAWFLAAILDINRKAFAGCRIEIVPQTAYAFGFSDEDKLGFEILGLNPNYAGALIKRILNTDSECWIAWSFKDPIHKTSSFGNIEDVSGVVLAHTCEKDATKAYLDVVATAPSSNRQLTRYLVDGLSTSGLRRREVFHDAYTCVFPRAVFDFADVDGSERNAPPRNVAATPLPTPRGFPIKAPWLMSAPEEDSRAPTPSSEVDAEMLAPLRRRRHHHLDRL